MDMSKMGDLVKLQQEAAKIKRELENTIIEAEVDGLVISINGEMKVEKVEFETNTLVPRLSEKEIEALCQAMVEAFNKGSKKAQEVAASRMQGVMSQMGLNMPAGGLPGA